MYYDADYKCNRNDKRNTTASHITEETTRPTLLIISLELVQTGIICSHL